MNENNTNKLVFPANWPKYIIDQIIEAKVDENFKQDQIDKCNLEKLEECIRNESKFKEVLEFISQPKIKKNKKLLENLLLLRENYKELILLGITTIETLGDILDSFYWETKRQQLLRKKHEKQSLVKCGLHAEHLKIGKNPKSFDAMVALLTGNDKEAMTATIDLFGFNLTLSEQNALFALQKAMTDKQYIEAINFRGWKTYSITITEYLEAFGVKKRLTKRGYNEYSVNERKEALEALESLDNRRALVWYDRKYIDNKNKIKIDTFRWNENVIKLITAYEKLTEQERINLEIDKDYQEKKTTRIIFAPCEALFDQIDTYYCLKNADYRQEIKKLYKKCNRYVYLFIDYLYVQANEKKRQKQSFEVRISTKELAYKLRMNKDIEQRRWKRINKTIKDSIDVAIKLEYILKHTQICGVSGNQIEVFLLNPSRFNISIENKL